MKTILKNIIVAAFAAVCLPAFATENQDAQQEVQLTYRRPSLCSFLVSRADQKMYDRIQSQYLEILAPDQYNDHNLSIRVLNVSKKGQYKDSIADWLDRNGVASRLVAKWFNRDMLTGKCSLDLVKQRGLYNASAMERELASRSNRGKAMLEDAGEDLIGNTFVLVHEAHYIDNEQRGKNVATGLKIGGALLGAFLGSGVSDLFDTFGDMAATIKGFRVKFHTTLYRLVWDDQTAGTFYQQMYAAEPNSAKKEAFERGRGNFRLEYVGEVESSGSQNSFLGINEEHPEIMIRKACCRAIDDNIADLQRNFESFRVRSPIAGVDEDGTVKVAIGMKEGINKDSEYEVLEPQEKDGVIKYKRVGVIAPIEGKIWDNRYMASEEGAVGADLAATSFKVKSGSTPYMGLLVRQIK